MSDAVSPADRAMPYPVDRFVVRRIDGVVTAIEAVTFVMLAAALIGSAVFQSSVVLLAGVACTIPVTSAVAAVRTRRAAAAVTAAERERMLTVAEAVIALQRLVVGSADELCRGGRPVLPERPDGQDEGTPAHAVLVALGEAGSQSVAALLRVHEVSAAAGNSSSGA
ncbi:hypothetical protein AB0465_37605 [Streptomyces griseoviridis]|uniref:hypothetical protein n=1 Tax=Streptomyces griseoviridis TaxID=45398 RepID=UPI00344F5463